MEINKADFDILVRSVEKLVKSYKDSQVTIVDILKKMEKIENNILEIKGDIETTRAEANIVKFNTEADEDLYAYMMDEKSKEAVDFPMTKSEIEKNIEITLNDREQL